jgi:hypothetical protein
MDLLLESLKNIYEDMDEEQRLLQEIEDMLMQPDEAPDEKQPDDKLELKPIEKPQEPPQDTTPARDPKQLVKPNVKPAAPKQAPAVTPKPAPNPAPKQTPVVPPTPAAEPAALPSLSKSTVKTPPRDLEPAEPEAPPVTVDPTGGGDPELQKNIYARLQRLRKAGKQFKSKLNSTALSYMLYNPRTRGLNVTFTKNGRTYHYKNVSMQKAAALFSSNSKGKLFNRDIKPNSKYVEV